MHVPVPVHAPAHRAKTELLAGVAVRMTGVPTVKLALHVCPQLIPAGALVTVPVPVPEFVTVSCTDAGGGGGVTLNFAVTEA